MNPDTLNTEPKRKRILVVDDEPGIVDLLKLTFEQSGFEAVTADSGPKALELINTIGLPHLAIVDLNMPVMSGFEFCGIVQRFCDLPVIILTAVDSEDVVIKGIERYAEDYMTKPFSPRELVARVLRVLRRIGDFGYTLEPVVYIDGHLAVDFAHQLALVAGRAVTLTPTESKLLYILMRNGGRTVTNDFLLRRLWPMEEIFEDTLRVHVRRLRQKIEKNASSPAYVLTERGAGYRFAPAQP
ncbi:MAG: response regulator transcription factor [Chloroflexi bacterium]|nr:response regulator transcription factor [Chloroflexota bacterium]